MADVESEEEDYMSDAFLAKLTDTRPGLAWGKKAKENTKEEKIKLTNQKNKIKPKKVLESEHRDEGLQKSISSENKGFALLAKMGYKPGMALGKKGTGIKEPVAIQLKTGRGGLGEEADKKRKQFEMNEMRARMAAKRKRLEGSQKEDFHASIRQKHNLKETERDLYKSQRVCEQLDLEQGIEKPERTFYWPPSALDKKQNEDEDVSLRGGYSSEVRDLEDSSSEEEEQEKKEDDEIDIPPTERLDILTNHLRSKWFYCVWCGTTYDDSEDMNMNCPGNNADAHR